MTRPRYRAAVEPDDDGKTVAAIVRMIVPDTSWNRARALCKTGRVRVDGALVFDGAQRLKADAMVEVDPVGPKRSATALEDDRIVHVDHEVVVVRKPAGLLTVPFEEDDRDTLLSRTRAALRQRTPLGVVQRLDKDTTGLLVFPRTRAARKHLQAQFRAHTIVRRYLAIVAGRAVTRTYETYLVPDRGDRRRGSWRGQGKPPKNAKRAVTHVEVLEELPGATLVACRLETGRQHQIRIHLAEAGTPLVGEKVYASREHPRVTSVRAPRPMLHATALGFRHPATDQLLRFDEPLPEDFLSVLERLRALAGEEPEDEPT
jgi:23S rRNA pseudouridine1911/1915/1917 synthase